MFLYVPIFTRIFLSAKYFAASDRTVISSLSFDLALNSYSYACASFFVLNPRFVVYRILPLLSLYLYFVYHVFRSSSLYTAISTSVKFRQYYMSFPFLIYYFISFDFFHAWQVLTTIYYFFHARIFLFLYELILHFHYITSNRYFFTLLHFYVKIIL